ncbi:hypothetical protein DPMN_096383 [Dreissena polymorpha]|uniref:Uncharacterized protein n=1 Tax=Dreissena polymorpha TaxID=45954 RepID=A0A9D4L9N4_DREPO|nr:hypothetical protein DPMN_096383 [Dreissena polymorpha]
MRLYDDDSATIRWRECENAMARMRKRHSTMTTMRQCDIDSATIRWRQCDMRQYDGEDAKTRWRECDDTMATVRCDDRFVAIVLSHCRHRIVALSSSYYRILALWILMCYHDGPYGIPLVSLRVSCVAV